MVKVDDTTPSKLPTGVRRQDPHIAGKDHIIGSIAIDQLDHFWIVGRTVLVPDELEWDVVLPRKNLALSTVPDQHDRIGVQGP